MNTRALEAGARAAAERRYEQSISAVEKAVNTWHAAESALIKAEREKRNAWYALQAAAQEPSDASDR